MSASLVLGLDVSTTATKAVLLERDGTVLAVAAAEYPFETPFPLWAEQDPALWWDAAQQTIKQVLAEAGVTGDDIAAIGAGGQMHGMVLLDEDGEVVRPAILWNDGRTAAQCDAIRAAVGRERLIEVTGNGAVEVAPDRAQADFAVETQADSAGEASAANAAAAAR